MIERDWNEHIWHAVIIAKFQQHILAFSFAYDDSTEIAGTLEFEWRAKKRVSRTDFFEAISKSYLCFLVVKNCVFENIKFSVHLCVLDLLRIQNTDISESLCCAQIPKKFVFHNINISDGQRIIMLSLYTEQPFYIFNRTDEVTPHLQILIKPTSSIQPGKHMFRTPGVHIRYSLESISASDEAPR